MFDIFNSVVKAAVGVVKLPVSVVADVVTVGGALTGKEESYISKNISDVVKNLENATDPRK